MDKTVKILEDSTTITGFYDKEADVLYISLGEPREGVAVDISDGAIARYHEDSETIVGITLIGLRQRVLKELNHKLHVEPHPNGWAVTEENEESSQKVFPTQEAAFKYAVGLAKAQWLDVIIHGENGEVQETINPAIDALLQRRIDLPESDGENHECLGSVL